ncbi:class I adenylate-forming enzyme family protein [soil metagenome]
MADDVSTAPAASPSAAWPAMSVDQVRQTLVAPGSPLEMETAVIRGVETRVWKNAPPSLRAVLETGRTHGQKVFTVYEDERVTYDAFFRASAKFAHELVAKGVKKGDRVAIIMRNLPEWPVAFFAAAAVGAIVTPLNAWWTSQELEYGLADSGAKIATVDAERFERIAEHLSGLETLEHVYVSRLAEEVAHPKVSGLEAVIGGSNDWAALEEAELPPCDIAPDDHATIFYTSGTTGKPKGALGTHRNITSNIFASMFVLARSFLRRGESPPTPDPSAPQRVILLSVPFFHATGCFAVLDPAVFTGGKIVLMHRWDPIKAFELIERERVTQVGGVPTIAWQLIEHPLRQNYDLSSLEQVAYGGAPSAPELVRQITGTFKGSAPGNGWGMTETSATHTSNLGEDYVNRPDSAGPCVGDYQIEVRDPDGKVLPTGVVGELYGKGPNIVVGYWNKPEASAETFKDGWVRTGDLARIDDEGFLFIIDRAKDMLIRGGENIYCVEVENALYEHPAVMDAAVVAVPHKSLGEEPGAVVTLKPGSHADEAELRAFVAERLAAFKVPVKILFRTETLPRNANGKILKSELKSVFADG